MTHSKNNIEHIIHDNGTEEWRLPNSSLHQDNDLPSIIYPNGTETYHKKGKYYREFGPDTKCPDGKEYWNTNKNYPWHREDGASRIETDGTREYRTNERIVTYEEFRKQH